MVNYINILRVPLPVCLGQEFILNNKRFTLCFLCGDFCHLRDEKTKKIERFILEII